MNMKNKNKGISGIEPSSALGWELGDCWTRANRNGKTKVGDWVCSGCANLNYSFRSVCNICKADRTLCGLLVFEVNDQWFFFRYFL